MKNTVTHGRGDSAAQDLRNRLRYHVTGAIERGEAEAITEQPAEHVREWRYFNANRAEHWITSPDFHDVIGEANTRQDARLMASVPELLAALKFVRKWDNMKHEMPSQLRNAVCRAIDNATAA